MRFLAAIIVSALPATHCTALHAQDTCAKRPAYESLRYGEDWRLMADPQCMSDAVDRIKFLPFKADGQRYLSLGGEARVRYERYRHPSFGSEIEDSNGYWLQRYLLHGDLHLGRSLRVFGQLQSSLVNGRKAGPRATDKDTLDANQLFADWTWRGADTDFFTLRGGRQEIQFGSARLVTARDGLNDRLSFDGLRVIGRRGIWRYGGWVTRPVLTEPDVFDDSSDATQTFSGAYAAWSRGWLPGGNAVVFLVDRKRDLAVYDQGRASERRYTPGFRVWGSDARWDYNWELGAQLGDFGPASIRAWYFATDTGYTVARVKFKPRFGLRLDAASGDRDPTDNRLDTFNPLFPSTAFSGLAGLIGPSNVIDVAPSVALQPNAQTTLTAGVIRFWRESTRDGIYATGGVLQRTGQQSRARHIGDQVTLQLVWNASVRLSLNVTGSYFVTGKFFAETPPERNVGYFTSYLNYRF